MSLKTEGDIKNVSHKQELGSFAITSLAYFVNLNKTKQDEKKGNLRGKSGPWY